MDKDNGKWTVVSGLLTLDRVSAWLVDIGHFTVHIVQELPGESDSDGGDSEQSLGDSRCVVSRGVDSRW